METKPKKTRTIKRSIETENAMVKLVRQSGWHLRFMVKKKNILTNDSSNFERADLLISICIDQLTHIVSLFSM